MLLTIAISSSFAFAEDTGLRVSETEQAKREITGTVVDAGGEPVIGANVVEKGTANGTITNADGSFAFSVSPGAVLEISYIGYVKKEAPVGNNTKFSITLEEDRKTLEEVVVVGYGTQKKVNLTGAVAQVKGDVLENRSVTNISQALQGQVANLNITSANGGAPGSTPSINLRGYTGFGSAAAPLIVIDGIQGGDLNSINMNDVENISVLKDAASAAIYGSSAPYGVILITTKRGQAGQKPAITYNNNFGFAQPINLPKMMNSLDFANFFNEAAANSGMAARVSDEQMQRIRDYRDGKITDQTIVNPTPGTDGWMGGNADNDWYEIFFKDASFSQQHNVGVSGSGGRANYYIGLGYLQQDGLYNYMKDKYQRYNVRANLSSDLTGWLTFSFRGAFSRGETDATATGYSVNETRNLIHWIGRLDPYDPYIYPNGDKYVVVEFLEQAGRNKQTRDNAVLTGEFVLHPLAGWDITANYTYDGVYVNSSDHVKEIYGIRPSGVTFVSLGSPSSFSRSFDRNQHHTVNVFTSYEKQMESHYFKATAGFTQELYDNLSVSGSNNYLYSNELPALSLTYGAPPSLGDGASQLAIRGGFGRINYNYREKYLFEFNGRYDGTSRFLKGVRNKFYPGVSAAWIPSKESFWKPLESIVNSLKIRATYGQLGDQGFTGSYYPFYPSLNTQSPTSSNYLFSGGRESYISQPSLVNTSLTWVTATTLDFGADLSFLSNRLNVSFDWYRRKMNDYAGPSEALPAFLGTSAPQTNTAAMKTEGFELTVGMQHRTKDFSFGANAVLSDYRSVVTRYPNPNGLIGTWHVGQQIGELWGYETYGLFQSEEEIASAPSQERLYSRWMPGDVRYADLDGNGVIDWGDYTLDNPGDRTVIGNSTPRFSFGLNLNVEYRGFDLAVFFQGIGKRDAAPDATSHMSNYFWGVTGDPAQSTGFVQQHDRWSESNPDGYYPKFYFTTAEMNKNKQSQSRYLMNAAYLRIKNLQLGYSLPASLLDKLNCQKLRLFVNVENLATATRMIKTMDPEFSNTTGFYLGADGKVYPLQRTWACGLNITF
ncbi:MAG: TonB-dependent receptor [Tannerella sp.]|jgi:TonB-linked SusC/RagA family outer membrane protein|nr:TonB-dependent receptor [Tannerella sp.]